MAAVPPGHEYLHAIEVLRGLKDSDRSLDRQVNKLLVLAPWLLLPNVGRYVRTNPGRVQEVLCLALDRADLDDEQFLGVTFSAIMAGG